MGPRAVDGTSVRSKRSEIIIALIGLAGVLATGVLSNWDKLFSHVVTASYQGYRPTGDFETELRYFFEIAGQRKAFESMAKQLTDQFTTALVAKYPKDAEQIKKIMSTSVEELPKFDSLVETFMPIYVKYYTLAEIQELNKFYSTDIMQQLVKTQPLIMQDAAPLFTKMYMDMQQRLDA